jgi:hypothetical protein
MRDVLYSPAKFVLYSAARREAVGNMWRDSVLLSQRRVCGHAGWRATSAITFRTPFGLLGRDADPTPGSRRGLFINVDKRGPRKSVEDLWCSRRQWHRILRPAFGWSLKRIAQYGAGFARVVKQNFELSTFTRHARPPRFPANLINSPSVAVKPDPLVLSILLMQQLALSLSSLGNA